MENFYTDNKDLKFHLEHPLMKRIVELKERNFADKDKFDYAPIDFEDAMDNYDRVTEIIGDISARIIAANADDVDKEGPHVKNERVIYARGTAEDHEALTQAGVIGMTFPRKYKGLNFPILPYVMAGEVISRADAGFANIWGLQDCGETIYEYATDEIKESILPRFNSGSTAAMVLTEPDAGSDLQSVQLKATFNEEKKVWLLNGVKRFITNGDAEISLVLARSEEGTQDGRGLSLFLFDKNNDNLSVRRVEHKLGIKGSPTCELVFKDAEAELIGDRKMGLIKYVMSLMNGARLGVGGQSVGISEAAYREALKYAKEREQFGKAIIKFPPVYEMLTKMQAKLRASRTLLYETARTVDIYKALEDIMRERKLAPEERKEMKSYKKKADFFTPLIKLMGSEYSNEIAYDSLQVHGGTGFMKDFPIERIYRDARITSIYEGTSQLQVVAAIRGVTTGFYNTQMEAYATQITNHELDFLKRELQTMVDEYSESTAKVQKVNDKEFSDFHARRLVEMAAHIIMGYLLVLDSQRDNEYRKTAEVYMKIVKTQNKERAAFIENSEIKDLGLYKI